LQIPSPVQLIWQHNQVEVWLKRDDLIHPQVSGNKWRKLKFYWQDFKKSNKSTLATFGGAYSNHLAATAAAGAHYKVPTMGWVRGQELTSNPTLDFCRAQGMQLHFISRQAYRQKDHPAFLKDLQNKYPHVYFIPEGGKGPLGIKGCQAITQELTQKFDWICASAGTGTTMAGMLLSQYPARYLAFAALKDQGFLETNILESVSKLAPQRGSKKSWQQKFSVQTNYHFGGYGKVNADLITFMNRFFAETGIKLDPIYTGKMFFGIVDLLNEGYFKPGSKILALHSGGLQGIEGMNLKLQKQRKTTLAYEA
jgi:1-aminocyclopropane-1-carboxylate deaminase